MCNILPFVLKKKDKEKNLFFTRICILNISGSVKEKPNNNDYRGGETGLVRSRFTVYPPF